MDLQSDEEVPCSFLVSVRGAERRRSSFSFPRWGVCVCAQAASLVLLPCRCANPSYSEGNPGVTWTYYSHGKGSLRLGRAPFRLTIRRGWGAITFGGRELRSYWGGRGGRPDHQPRLLGRKRLPVSGKITSKNYLTDIQKVVETAATKKQIFAKTQDLLVTGVGVGGGESGGNSRQSCSRRSPTDLLPSKCARHDFARRFTPTCPSDAKELIEYHYFPILGNCTLK